MDEKDYKREQVTKCPFGLHPLVHSLCFLPVLNLWLFSWRVRKVRAAILNVPVHIFHNTRHGMYLFLSSRFTL